MMKFRLIRIMLTVGIIGTVLTFQSCGDGGDDVDVITTLSTPQNVTATAKTTTVLVEWDAVNDAETYEIKRTFNGTETTYTATQTSYTDASPGVGSNSYAVRALAEDAVTSEWSAAVSCTFVEEEENPDPLEIPANVTAKKSGETVVVTWDAVDGATGYNVYKGTLSNPTYTLLDSTTETTLTDSSPEAGDNYYKITATRGDEETEMSSGAVCNFISTNFFYSDVITAYDAFNAALFNTDQKMYRNNTAGGNGRAVNWIQATYFDMIMNAYRLTKDTEHLQRLADMYTQGCPLYCKFEWYNWTNSTWKWDLYDDMMWWVGTLARAALFVQEFPEAEQYGLSADDFLATSVEGFDRVWYGSTQTNSGVYYQLDHYGSYAGDDPDDIYIVAEKTSDVNRYVHWNDSGMYWDWMNQRYYKPSCINWPTVVAAMYIHKADPTLIDNDFAVLKGGDGSYLDKAKDIYNWSVDYLFRTNTGQVANGRHSNGTDGFGAGGFEAGDLLYNQATCIGSACLLYLETKEQKYLDHAIKAMEYVEKNMLSGLGALAANGSQSQADTGDEMGIYNAILAQYIPLLVVDCEQEQFLQTIETSIRIGWMNRNLETDLCNKVLDLTPSNSALSSYSASGVPALMLTFPDVKNRIK